MYNKIIMIGNLTRDPELKNAPSGTPVCGFGIAVNKKYKKDNEMKEEVTFINVIVFGKQAESCGQYLNKGSQVLVEGSLRESRWETEDGKKSSKHEIIAQSVRFMSKAQAQEGTDKPEETTDIEPF